MKKRGQRNDCKDSELRREESSVSLRETFKKEILRREFKREEITNESDLKASESA